MRKLHKKIEKMVTHRSDAFTANVVLMTGINRVVVGETVGSLVGFPEGLLDDGSWVGSLSSNNNVHMRCVHDSVRMMIH